MPHTITSSLTTHNRWTRAGAAAPRAAGSGGPDVAALFERWNDALATGNPDTVAALYAEDAVLLPTVADEARAGRAAIRDYFVYFLQSQPRGEITERYVQSDHRIAVDIGTYVFMLAGGKRVAARYTFVYRRVGGQWLITHHHSSVMPEQFCKL